MPVRINTAARNAAADAAGNLIDGGAGPGVLRIYSGSQPATPATSPTGTLLAEFTLSDPAFGAAANGVKTLDVTPALTDTGLAADTAGYARFLDSTEAAGTGLGVVDGTVGISGAMVNLNTTTISVGVAVEITSGTLTMPAE